MTVQTPGRLQKADLILLLGILAAVLAIACLMVFAEGERAVGWTILWGWVVEVAIWVYVFLTAL